MKYIPELNGLRGVAALMVFFAHSAKVGFLPDFLEKQYGQMALLILFVLSGFLISHQYLYKPLNREMLIHYGLARVSRVFPAYLLVLVISFFISSYFYPAFRYNFQDPQTLLYAMLFIGAPYELWSIPVEVQFYLLFIFIWFVYQKLSKKFLVLLLIPLSMLTVGILFYLDGGKAHTIWLFAINFFFGTIISIFLLKKALFQKAEKINRYLAVTVFILTIALIPLSRKLFGINLPARLDPLKPLFVISTFIFIITNPGNFRFLTSRVLLFMGEISFAFYLFHRPLLEIGKANFGNSPLCLTIILIVTGLLAALSTFYFEKRIAKTIRSLVVYFSPKREETGDEIMPVTAKSDEG